MGKFDKRALSMWADFECERQLFINLGRDDENWIKPMREIEKEKRKRVNAQGFNMGRDYEEIIYRWLSSLKEARYKLDPSRKILQSRLDKEVLTSLPLDSHSILLEHYFPVNEDYLRSIFDNRLPVRHPDRLRPDILLVKQIEGRHLVVNPDGSTRWIVSSDGMMGIRVFDIKATNSENVGKKHFIEILFYQHALSFYLKEIGMDDRFVVLADHNGILPNTEDVITGIEKFEELTVQFLWKDVEIIYHNALSTIREMVDTTPVDIINFPTNLQPACGRCSFIEDCKMTFGISKPVEDWSVDLIPYLEPSTVEELKARGAKTVGEASQIVEQIKVGSTPQPLYVELPLLKLKIKALLKQEKTTPEDGQVSSMNIPKYTDISIFVDANSDPIKDVVFNFGVRFTIFVGEKSSYFDLFKQVLLYVEGLAEEYPSELDIEQLNSIRDIFSILKKDTTVVTELNYIGENLLYTAELAYVSGGITNTDEFNLAARAVSFFSDIVTVTTYLEESVRVQKGEYLEYPRSAVYYWSRDILSALESMMERNMYRLFLNPATRLDFQRVATWLTPSESKVKNDLQMSKIYDLRVFAETFLGFPLPINYTWHDIWRTYDRNFKISYNFWNPHFNYMDFNQWHRYLSESDNMKKIDILSEIRKQSLRKLKVLDGLKREFQKEWGIISMNARPVTTSSFQQRVLPELYHEISKVWYLFAKLTGTVQELQSENFRHMYPEYSVGKLEAAEVHDIMVTSHTGPRGGKTYSYEFSTEGLSTNMKMDIGSYLLLVPEEYRDYRKVKFWGVRIKSMTWQGGKYRIETYQERKNFIEEFERDEAHKSSQWYLFNTTSDHWSKKLFDGSKGLLTYRSLGQSWLGHRLTYIWELSIEKIKPPRTESIDIAEVYMYAPKRLQQIKPLEQVTELVSDTIPRPDPSQSEAILNSLNSVLSFIQGPPGTGKSQTITALIEEILRRKPKVKILVTAFSYQAKLVILEKMNSSPSTVLSGVEKIFVRSAGRQAVENARDFVRINNTWKLDGQSRVVTKTKRVTDKLQDTFVMFANAHQLYHMMTPKGGKLCFDPGFAFDYIIVDEASQMPVDQFLSAVIYTRKIPTRLRVNSDLDEDGFILDHGDLDLDFDAGFDEFTKIILVGDHNQLPPVQPVTPPTKLERVLSSIFSYYVEHMELDFRQLSVNYRSHDHIVEFTRSLGIYEDLTTAEPNRAKTLEGDFSKITEPVLLDILDPQKVMVSLIHDSRFDTAVSEIEAQITADLAVAFFKARNPRTVKEEKDVWRKGIGIVAPHNAHGRLIVRLIFDEIYELSKMSAEDLMDELRSTTFSVEKFQGSDRDFIIGTIGVSSKIQLQKEEEFIYQINRFNVLTSRGKSKIVLIVAQNFLNYLPRKREVLKNASRIRSFVEMCNVEEKIEYKKWEIFFRYMV